jgi:hypothetical protein
VLSGRLDDAALARLVVEHARGAVDPIVALCAASVDVLEVSGAGVMLMAGDNEMACLGVSDARAERVEQIEYTLGEGPCLDACRSARPIEEPDLGGPGARWPGFRDGAVAEGIVAVYAFPMSVADYCIGALNLFRDRPGLLSDDQRADACVIAHFAAKRILEWQSRAPMGAIAWQLQEFPRHREVVHQATGMVAVQAAVSASDAHALMQAHAFAHQRLIGEIASDVVAGALRFG